MELAVFPSTNAHIKFPPGDDANEDGILAIGGKLSIQNLLNAYQIGAFPWYNKGEPIIWHHPNPRCVLFPNEIKISHSMRTLINSRKFRFTFDQSFSEVIAQCRHIPRKDQPGTWIHDEIEKAYNELFTLGYAHSAEVWEGTELVGGLYGVLLGRIFFGESMFSTAKNASKFALIKMTDLLQKNGIRLIDCQVTNPHLISMGAKEIPRAQFVEILKSCLS